MFQPYPSEIVFQNYSPFKTYKVPLELRNSDKVTFILLRRLYSQFVAQLHNECIKNIYIYIFSTFGCTCLYTCICFIINFQCKGWKLTESRFIWLIVSTSVLHSTANQVLDILQLPGFMKTFIHINQFTCPQNRDAIGLNLIVYANPLFWTSV